MPTSCAVISATPPGSSPRSFPAHAGWRPDGGSAAVPPEEERHRLFDGVARFLVARSRRAPILLLLDDLHWADRSTVAMLRHLVRLAGPERLLVIGTYRDVDLDRAHPLTEALAAWPREAGYEHVDLGSLDGEEVTAFLGAVCGQDVELEGRRRLGPGNRRQPVLHPGTPPLPHEEGKLSRGPDGRWTTSAPLRDLALPVAARDVAARRLSRLSEQANRLLTVAAAFQGAFRFEVVADLAGLSEDEGLDALEEAVGARILEPSGDSETYAFTHAVIRHAPLRRARPVPAVPAAPAGGRGAGNRCRVDARLGRRDRRPLPPQCGPPRGRASASSRPWRPPTTPRPRAPTTRRPRSCAWPSTCCPTGDARKPRILGRLGIVLAWALAFDDAVDAAGQAGDAIAEAETKQAAAEYLSDAAYACASAGGIVASWDLARQGLTYAGARDVAWARLLCFDYQRREAEDPDHPGIPIDSAERREAAAILRAAHLDPLGPAPMEAVFDTRAEAAAVLEPHRPRRVGRPSTGNRCRSDRGGGPARPRPSAGWPERPGPGRTLVLLPCRPRAAGRGAPIAGAGRRPGRAPGNADSDRHLSPAASLRRTGRGLGAGRVDLLVPGLLRQPGAGLGARLCPRGWAQAAAHAGDPAEALEAVRLLVPWLERAPAWTIAYPAMVCGAADALWVLERLDHVEVIETGTAGETAAGRFPRAMTDGRPGPRPAVRPDRTARGGRAAGSPSPAGR